MLNWFLAVKNKIANVNFSFVWVGEFSSFFGKTKFFAQDVKKTEHQSCWIQILTDVNLLIFTMQKRVPEIAQLSKFNKKPKTVCLKLLSILKDQFLKFYLKCIFIFSLIYNA